jgi:hypothetical protein
MIRVTSLSITVAMSAAGQLPPPSFVAAATGAHQKPVAVVACHRPRASSGHRGPFQASQKLV